MNKLNLAILFGGRAVEHEISIISALQLIKALDTSKYNLIPIYVAPNGKWYHGEILLDKSIYKSFANYEKYLAEVTLLPQPDQPGLQVIDSGFLYKNKILCTKNHKKYISVDVYFPVFHGEYGEDGCIQGLFEMADVTYVGCNVTASAIAMNKQACKDVVRANDIPVLPAFVADKFEFIENANKIIEEINSTAGLEGFPLFVKPCNRGSSVGIGKANDTEELKRALLNVFKYDLQAIIEPCLEDMFEINIAILDCGKPLASVVEIPYSDSGILSYEDKYMKPGSKKTAESQGMADLARAIDPDDLAPDIKKQVTDYALKAFKVLGCSGNGRFDFIFDHITQTPYFNELNPVPGSLAFYLWAGSKPARLYTDTIDDMVNTAIEIKEQKASLKRDIGFKAL